jgi:glutathione S-transferase
MITLYDYLPSQNAYKARLLLSHLQRPYVTLFDGPEFRERASLGERHE